MIDKDIAVTIGNSDYIWRRVKISQYDTDWRFKFTVYEGNEVYNIPSGSVAVLNGKKKDGTVFTYAGSILDNIVTVVCDKQLSSAAGDVECELRISESGGIVSSANFIFDVEASPISGFVLSENDFSALDQITNRALESASRIGAVEEALEYIKSAVGSPLVANTVSDMTDHDKIYVYTGSEDGYTEGDWYYWDGSVWTSGGVYNAVAIDTDKTLSVSGMAADAKACGDLKSQTNRLEDAVFETNDINFDNETAVNGVVRGSTTSSPGTWNSNSIYKSYFIPVTGAKSVTITANATQFTSFAFLKNNNVVANQLVPFCDGVTGRIDQSPGTTVEYDVPSDCTYVTVFKNDNHNTYTPASMTFYSDKIPVVDNTLSVLGDAADAKATGEAVGELKDALRIVIEHNDVDFTNLTLRNGVLRDAGTYNDSSSYKSYFIPISGPSEVKITANNSQYAVFAFLKNDAVIGEQTAPFAAGETGRRTLAAGTTASYRTPDDCRCIYVYATGSGNTYTPSGMTIDTDVVSGDLVYALVSGGSVAKYINGSGLVRNIEGGTSYQFANNNYGAITVTAGALVAHVSFVKSSIADIADNTAAPLASEEPARHDVAAGETMTLFVPHDCEYIIVMRSYGNDNFTPSSGHIFANTDAVLSCAKVQPNGMSKSGVTACIIGASIEAGRTHDRITGASNALDPDKAYLTVALRNNGVIVTNKSQGGMGWKSVSNAGNYTCKGIVDDIIANEGFSSYDSLYFCLGANDWSHDATLGTTEDAAGADTVCGQMRYAIESVFADNPGIKMIVKYTVGKGDELNGASPKYTKNQLIAAMETICAEYGVEMVRLGWIYCNANKDVTTDYYPRGIFPDGVHPCPEIMAQMAKDATGRITFK